jgi:hypothetical protein
MIVVVTGYGPVADWVLNLAMAYCAGYGIVHAVMARLPDWVFYRWQGEARREEKEQAERARLLALRRRLHG